MRTRPASTGGRGPRERRAFLSASVLFIALVFTARGRITFAKGGHERINSKAGLCPPLRGSPAPGGGSFAPQQAGPPCGCAGRVTPPPLRGHPTRVRRSAAPWLRRRLFFVVPPKRGPLDFRLRSTWSEPGSRGAAHTTSHRLRRGGAASPRCGAPTGLRPGFAPR